ncbi:MAG: DUF2283 domain-containing protein [Candidatus Nanohaloarchaea archaeon]
MKDLEYIVEFKYNPELDIITIDKEGRSPEEYEESLPMGDYIVDIDNEGNFLGLELLNASQNLPFNKEELEKIEKVELSLKERGDARTIGVDIEYSGSKGKFSLGYATAKA